jgi:uncharacterized membrane protein
MTAVLDFAASRRRIEARAEHSMEFVPRATLIERMAATMTKAELAEALHLALNEGL